MWSFVAPVKLDSAAPVFSRNQIRNGLKTHIKKPVLRVLLNKRGLAPVVSDDWDKVIAVGFAETRLSKYIHFLSSEKFKYENLYVFGFQEQ